MEMDGSGYFCGAGGIIFSIPHPRVLIQNKKIQTPFGELVHGNMVL